MIVRNQRFVFCTGLIVFDRRNGEVEQSGNTFILGNSQSYERKDPQLGCEMSVSSYRNSVGLIEQLVIAFDEIGEQPHEDLVEQFKHLFFFLAVAGRNGLKQFFGVAVFDVADNHPLIFLHPLDVAGVGTEEKSDILIFYTMNFHELFVHGYEVGILTAYFILGVLELMI